MMINKDTTDITTKNYFNEDSTVLDRFFDLPNFSEDKKLIETLLKYVPDIEVEEL